MAGKLTEAQIDALPLTAETKAGLKAHYGYTDGGYQSRDQSAYDGAKLAPWGAGRGGNTTGKVVAKPATPVVVLDKGAPVGGTTATYPTLAAAEKANASMPDRLDPESMALARAEYGGGPVAGYKVPVAPPFKFSAPMVYDQGHEGTMLLTGNETTADLEENVVPEYAAEIKKRMNAQQPMGALVVKAPVAPGADYYTSAKAIPAEAFDAPLPAGKPLTSVALPAAPSPALTGTYAKKEKK